MDRYLKKFILNDVKRKSILLCGPRQIGKTTLAKSLYEKNIEYLNYDVLKDRKVIVSQSWRKDARLLILDEIHKLKKWKNFLKGVIDEYNNSPELIVTGSARLDVFRKSGDALTGRTFSYHLMPIDLEEAKILSPEKSSNQLLEYLLKTGGFPESFFTPELSERLLINRIETLLQEDTRDLTRITEIKSVELLIELLRERVGGQIVYSNLAQDLSVSAPTVKNWIELLEKLYLIFLIRPYAANTAKSIRKEPKFYFYDCIAAIDNEGSKFENLVAVSLLKWCHLKKDTEGREVVLSYYRDRDQREVDFVITEKRKVLACIEVKLTEDNPSQSLKYLTERVSPIHSIQLVKNLVRNKDFGRIKIRAASEWLSKIEL